MAKLNLKDNLMTYAAILAAVGGIGAGFVKYGELTTAIQKLEQNQVGGKQLVTLTKSIENKADKIGKKEIKEISKFLQQPESELKIVMGEPNEITYDDKGSKFFIYTKKKYNITCERKFEINQNKMIVGFTSKGCF